MKYIKVILLLIILMFTSCVNQKSVLKWIKKHPDKVDISNSREFKTRVDTINVFVKGDTINEYIETNAIDTVYQEGRAEVRFVLKRDTITKINKVYIKALCKPDTIKVLDRDTITINKTIIGVKELNWWNRNNWWIVILLLVSFIIALLVKKGVNLRNYIKFPTY